MTELGTPHLAMGGIALAAAIFYGAWHEFQTNNACDAKLLSTFRATALAGSVVAWMI